MQPDTALSSATGNVPGTPQFTRGLVLLGVLVYAVLRRGQAPQTGQRLTGE